VTALPLPENLSQSGEWLVQAIDPYARLARLIRMDPSAYAAESFLDDRMLAAGRETRLCNLDELIASAKSVTAPPAGWIFHIGHVGSTLVSRMLGELGGVLSIREPRALRDLAEASEQERPRVAAAVSRLMSRRDPDGQAAIVKATSAASEYAPLLVEPSAKALLLYASPRQYISGILAGKNSDGDLGALHDRRLKRLADRGIVASGFDGSNASRAALAWASEMVSLEAAAAQLPQGATLWADFDAMLSDMTEWLGRCARHFEISTSQHRIAEVATGPLLRSYSKAPEYEYSPAVRAQLLAGAGHRHRSDIEGALIALTSLAESAPLLARALERAG